MSRSTVETYRTAAQEHLERAQRLFDSADNFFAHYIAGLAVECHLRAHLRSITSQFDARHDLRMLAESSGYFDRIPPHQLHQFSQHFTLLNARWRSHHRYCSAHQFLDDMGRPNAMAREELRSPGDPTKILALRILQLAYDIIEVGESRWDDRSEIPPGPPSVDD